MPTEVKLAGAFVLDLPTSPLVGELRRQGMGMATVRLGQQSHPDGGKVPAVLPDRQAAWRLAADHFADRDFRHVAFVGREPWG